MKKFLIIGLVFGMVLGGFVYCHVGKAQAATPITDGNGDGVVDISDLGALAGDWLGAGYAGLESNCRIDIGFYEGTIDTIIGSMSVEHGLGRVPEVILVFPLDTTLGITPAVIVGDPDTGLALYKFLDGTAAYRFPGITAPTCDTFMLRSIIIPGTSINSEEHSLGKLGIRYLYIALCKEIPAMPAE